MILAGILVENEISLLISFESLRISAGIWCKMSKKVLSALFWGYIFHILALLWVLEESVAILIRDGKHIMEGSLCFLLLMLALLNGFKPCAGLLKCGPKPLA